MIFRSNRSVLALPLAGLLSLSALVALAACGGDPKPAETPPTPTETPTAAPTAAAPAPTDAPVASAAPTAAPSATADAKAPPKPSSGRPAVLKSDPQEVTDTYGSSPGAKIIIGSGNAAGTFKIPENALRTGTVITVKLDAKAKSTGVPIGKIFHITAFVPPANAPSNIESEGPPFEVILPAGNKKDANLAIGTVVTDDAGKEKITWKIIAPKRIDDAAGLAYYEITGFSDTLLHVTTKPPTK
ncbi:MAG: hypothetical protein U0359_15945 [Byssovorax sp.]